MTESLLHATLVELFRAEPSIAIPLLKSAQVPLPTFEIVVESSEQLSELVATERRADVVLCGLSSGLTTAIIIEVQLHQDENKPFVWPAYLCETRNAKDAP